MKTHWLHYQARNLYAEWGRAAGFVLGFWLALLLLLPLVVPEPPVSRTAGGSALPQVGAGPPEAPAPALEPTSAAP